MFISKMCGCSSKKCSCCSSKDLKKLTGDLTILSVKSRLNILFFLRGKSHCVCDLVMHTGMSQSLVSHHLADLSGAGFVNSKREGKYMNYSLSKKGNKFLESLILIMGDKKGGERKNGKR